eukprot:1743508-Rhodomonas_salina.2
MGGEAGEVETGQLCSSHIWASGAITEDAAYNHIATSVANRLAKEQAQQDKRDQRAEETEQCRLEATGADQIVKQIVREKGWDKVTKPLLQNIVKWLRPNEPKRSSNRLELFITRVQGLLGWKD